MNKKLIASFAIVSSLVTICGCGLFSSGNHSNIEDIVISTTSTTIPPTITTIPTPTNTPPPVSYDGILATYEPQTVSLPNGFDKIPAILVSKFATPDNTHPMGTLLPSSVKIYADTNGTYLASCMGLNWWWFCQTNASLLPSTIYIEIRADKTYLYKINNVLGNQYKIYPEIK